MDLNRVDGFDWDERNRRKNVGQHGVTAAEAEQLFFESPLMVANDPHHSETEPRFHALGKTSAGRLLHVTFTLRQGGTKVRVISARDMSRKE